MSQLQRRRTQVVTPVAKSVDVRKSRAITPNITRKSVSQGRQNVDQPIPNDLMNIYNFKAENIAKDLMHLVRLYEYEPVTVIRAWKEECGRYIECHGLKLKPLHEIGKILKSNGLFLVAYAKMQIIISSHSDPAHIKREIATTYADQVTKQTLEFRRYFGETPNPTIGSEGTGPAVFQAGQRVPCFGGTVTPQRKPVTKINSALPDLKRNPVAEGREVRPTTTIKPAESTSLSFRDYVRITGQKVDEKLLRTSSNKKSVFLPSQGPLSTLPLGQRIVAEKANLYAVYTPEIATFSRMIVSNYKNKDVFGVCIIFRKHLRPTDPARAIINLKNFEHATDEDIDAMLAEETMILFRVKPDFFDEHCNKQKAQQ